MPPGDPQADLLAVNLNPRPAPAGDRGEGSPPPPDPRTQTKPAPAQWDDALALQVVINDFSRAEQHRSQNFDRRWDENDNLYHANVPQRVWEGTSVPRSSIGVKLVWQQLESLLPRALEALFNSQDGIYFDCFPYPGTTPDQGRACRYLLASQLEETNFREAARLTLKSAGLHGTGIVKFGWLRQEREREIWQDALVPRLVNVGGVQVALGFDRRFGRQKYKEQINRPFVEYVSVRDFYIDPSHKRSQVEGAKFVAHRAMITMDDLLAMGDDPSYKIPAKEELIRLVVEKAGPARAAADSSKQMAAMEAGILESYPTLGSTDPAKYPFEVIEYWTAGRLVTILDRKRVIRNIPNPYGFIPFLSIVYTDVLDQFYGKGLADILEGEQRVQQGIINARLDELALIIHGQLVYQEGAVVSKHQLRPRPGGAIGVTGDVRAALQALPRQPVAGEAFAEVAQSQARAQQYTGITDVVVQGAPSAPTSATRTATGIGVLARAAFSRIEYLVENVGNLLIVPLLGRLMQLNQRFLDPAQALQVLGPFAQAIAIDPLAVTNALVRFEMRAASRMVARAAMQQSLPFVLQVVLNPALIEAMGSEGLVPNLKAIVDDTLDVLGWRTRESWFRQLSEEEMAARRQPEMTPEVLKFMKEQMRVKAKGEQQSQQQTVDIFKTILERALEEAPGASAAALGMTLDDVQKP